MTRQEFTNACKIAERLVDSCDAEASAVARALLAAAKLLGTDAFNPPAIGRTHVLAELANAVRAGRMTSATAVDVLRDLVGGRVPQTALEQLLDHAMADDGDDQ